MGRVVCIANQKGGVGKTTTSINLSASLAMNGHRVLLIDLDPQANATSGLGVRDLENRPSTYDLLMGERPVDEIVAPTTQDGLEILPAQRDLVGAEVELVQALAREHRLAEALAPVRERYDIIIVDCPPSLGLLTINGLTAADGVLIPLQCEYYALEGLSALMDTVRLIRDRLNPSLEIEGILLTMFDTRNSLSHQVAAEVREHFATNVFTTTIPRNVRLSESPSHGVPAAQYDPTSKGALAYLDLANELLPGSEGDRQPVQVSGISRQIEDSTDVPIGTESNVAAAGSGDDATEIVPADVQVAVATTTSDETAAAETPALSANDQEVAGAPTTSKDTAASETPAFGPDDQEVQQDQPAGLEPQSSAPPDAVNPGDTEDADRTGDQELAAPGAWSTPAVREDPAAEAVEPASPANELDQPFAANSAVAGNTTTEVEDGSTKEGLGEGARGADRPGQADDPKPDPDEQEPANSSDRGNLAQ